MQKDAQNRKVEEFAEDFVDILCQCGFSILAGLDWVQICINIAVMLRL